jgi:signal transduction histidine kinase
MAGNGAALRITRFAGLSIRHKLIAIIMLTSSAALLVASAAFVVNEVVLHRQAMRREITTIAQILATNSTAALTFGDQKSAGETLAMLTSEQHIIAAAVYDDEGRIFASYTPGGRGRRLPPAPERDGARFEDSHLRLFHGVFLDGNRLGTVYLMSDLDEMYSRLRRYAYIAAIVLLASVLVALLLSSRLQQLVSAPILDLAHTASRVSREKDYTVRAIKRSQDELGVLVDQFNEMLFHIHARDEALQAAHSELENRVQERTRELQNEVAGRRRAQEELQAAKEAAEEANRAKSVFLANMSHELRTPLNAIIGYSELMMEEAEDAGNDSFRSDLQKVHSAGRHLLSVINDILDISKIEAGRTELYLEDMDVTGLIEDAVSTIQPLAQKNGNQLRVCCAAGLGVVPADVTKFRQSLFNLLSNACKFTENGEVRLDVSKASENGREWVCWSVTDTGIGITPEHRNKLFLPFSQVDASTTRKFGGTGLGLAISQKFCHMMGGEITVDSTPGQGSTFTIRLPATVHGGPRQPASEEEACPGS